MLSQTKVWVSRLITRELQAFERELELFPDDAMMWRVAPGVTNSVGNLVLHCCGNLQHFVGQVLGGSGYIRDRDAEFGQSGLSRDVLIRELRAAEEVVRRVLANLSDEQLNRPFPEAVGGATIQTGLFLTHLVAHLAFHLGQAGYLRRVLTQQNQSAGPLPLKPLSS